MSRIMPPTYSMISERDAYNARPDSARVMRGLALNQHYLWGHRLRQAAAWASRFKDSTDGSNPYEEAYTIDTGAGRYITKFLVPPSYGPPGVSVTVRVYFDGGNGSDNVTVMCVNGRGEHFTEASKSTSGSIDVIVYVDAVDKLDRITVWFVEDGGGAAYLESVCAWFTKPTSSDLGGRTTLYESWQALSQDWCVADRPHPSYVLTQLCKAQNALWALHQPTVCQRWLRGYIISTGNYSRCGYYAFYVPPTRTGVRCYIYTRVSGGGAGKVTFRFNGGGENEINTSATTTWGWQSGTFTSVLTANAVNYVEVLAKRGESGSVYVGGVVIVEDEPNSSDLSLPGADDIPAAFIPLESTAFGGQKIISATDDKDGNKTGVDYMISNMIWLQARRTRTLVADYRFKAATTVAGLTTGAACDGQCENQTTHVLTPNDTGTGESGGNLLTAGLLYSSVNANKVDCYARVAQAIAHKSTNLALWPWYLKLQLAETDGSDANLKGCGYQVNSGLAPAGEENDDYGLYFNPSSGSACEFWQGRGAVVPIMGKTITDGQGAKELYLTGFANSQYGITPADGYVVRCNGCLILESPLTEADLDAL